MKSIFTLIASLLFSLLHAQEPALVWAKQLGGTSYDYSYSIAVDALGNVYTTGAFSGTADFNPGAGTANLTSAGGDDIFVTKLDAAGNFVWAKSMGGTTTDFANSIAVDASGNVYTTGYFDGTADFDPGTGTANRTAAGFIDAFVSKLDDSGSFLWVKTIGGSGNTLFGNSITVDASNVYLTGSFDGTVDFDPGASMANLTSAGGEDIFVSKLDASGNYVWAKNMGGAGFDNGYAVAVDASGNVYTTGYFNGTADFDPGAGITNLTSGGSADIFISKLNVSGNVVWAKSFSGADYDQGYSITVDASGNVYTTGFFQGTADFNPGTGTAILTSAGSNDIFVSKLDASGNFVWAKQLGGTGNDIGYSKAVDASGGVYTTGLFNGTVDFNPGAGTANLISAGIDDIFVSKLDASGNYVWAKSIGGTSSDEGRDITVDASGNVYTTGSFRLTADFDPGTGTTNLTSAGNTDVFVLKLSQPQPSTAPTVTTTAASSVTSNSAQSGGNVTSNGGATVNQRGVVYSATTNPTIDNVGTTQLNDATGGTGSFISYLTGLTSSTTYYVRAFATNSAGTSYGTEESFTTAAAGPTVTTTTATSITSTTASSGGNITSDGGSAVTTRGVVYGTLTAPTIAGAKTSDGTGTGSFTSSLTGLNPNTVYYYRAYASSLLGNGFDFDGTGDRITIDGLNISPSVRPTLTIEAWVNPRNAINLQALVGNDNGGFDRSLNIWNGTYHIFAGRDINTGIAPTLNKWEHVAATWSTSGINFYRNGVLLFTTSAETIDVGPTFTYISGNTTLNGVIDEVRIWNTIRTQAEIQANMNAELSGSQSGLAAYYKFNQGTANASNTGLTTVAADPLGGAFPGTLTNAALSGTTSNWVTGAQPPSTGISYGAEMNFTTASNSPAVITISTTDTSYTSGIPVVVDPNIAITDANNANLTGATVKIAANFQTSDRLQFTNQNNITGNYNTTTGVLSLSGSSSVTNYQAALRTIRFFSNIPNPSTASRTIRFRAFDGTDSSNIATRTVTITVPVFTPPGNALNFDGVDDYVQGTNSQLPTGNSRRTIEAWINPVLQNSTIFNWGNRTSNNRSGLLYINGRLFFVGEGNDLMGNIVIPANKWTHVAATFDGATLKLYVDGVLDVSANKTLNTTNPNFRIGVSSGTEALAEYFNGSIDEVRVWNVDLSQTQIQTGMRMPPNVSSTELVAYYNFDQGVPGGNNAGLTTLYDQKGTGNNGTLNNFGLTGNTSNWVESYAMVVPTAIAATTITPTSFTANWTAPTVGTVDYYLLDVSTNSAFSSFVANYQGRNVNNVTSFNVNGLSAGTTYYYRVRAFKASVGEGANSNTITTTTTCPTRFYVNQSATTGANNGTSWADAFTDLQSAFNSTCTAMEIWVANGTYKPTSTAVRTIYFQPRTGDQVYGGFAGTETSLSERNTKVNNTTLSGDIGVNGTKTDNSYHVVNLVSKDNIRLDGFIISDGYADGSQLIDGGGVYVSGGSNMTFDSLRIINNYAAQYGGGMVIFSSNTGILIKNSEFQNNFAGLQGGGLNLNFSNLTITSSRFKSNSTTITSTNSFNVAGGFASSGTLTMDSCFFELNTSDRGGGFFNGGTATVSNSIFKSNRAYAPLGGGGASSQTSISFSKCYLSDNVAETQDGLSGEGGGFTGFFSGTHTFTNCVIANNEANGPNGRGGGGISFSSPGSGVLNLVNTTLFQNTTKSINGGANGIFQASGSVNVTNTIIWGSAAKQVYSSGGSINYTTSLVKGETTNCPNVKTTDPVFVDSTDVDGPDDVFGTADDGLMIQPNSPAKNSGTTVNPPTDDVVGTPRPQGTPGPQGSAYDIGAYETLAGGTGVYEINVQGNGTTITDGDVTPSATDSTVFARTNANQSSTRTYTIQNSGTDNLTINGITITGTDAAMFTAGALTPAGPIAPNGGSATITVTFTPTAAGTATKTATINIANSDCDESDYDFAIQGTRNTAPEITSNRGGATYDTTIAENITAVTTVVATDVDVPTTLTYSIPTIGGADSSKFIIDATTGVLTFKTAPNFEMPTDVGANNTYTVIVRATDEGRLFDEQTITVTISNVNDAPIITSNGGGSTASISMPENTTLVTTIQATDPDNNISPDYSITGGADRSKFTISSTTGELRFITAPDFELPTDADGNNTYIVNVRAQDQGGLFVDQLITVTVTNVNEGVLPVNLVNVKAYQKGSGIQVEWTTLTEINTDRFEVEKSTDGQTFAPIGSVAAKGNSTSLAHYQLLDQLPFSGNNYYRIKNIDKDGSAQYSNLVRVRVEQGSGAVNVYPNPVTDNTIRLQFNKLPKGRYTVTLSNKLGQQLYRSVLEHNGDSSTQTLRINSSFPKGSYQLQVIGDDVQIIKQLIKK